MTIKITSAIMMVIALIAIAPNARAEIASKQYVDDQDKTYIFGTTTPTSDTTSWLARESGGLFGFAIRADQAADFAKDTADDALEEANSAREYAMGVASDALGKYQYNNGILIAKDNRAKVASGGVINDSLISSNAAIQLGKLGFPTPGAECATRGCMLMFYNGQYVWETVTRDTNETIATTGAVSATPSTGTTVTENNAETVD